jgi:hypothetical protein
MRNLASNCVDCSDAFAAGEAAFKAGLRPLDNPYFADAERVDEFNAWSDGWQTAQDAKLPVSKRLLTWLRTPRGNRPAWWTRNDLLGITATWAAHRIEASA